LIASGVHTIAVCMRLYVDHYISQVASLASPGLDEIRWPRPVRPGDRLRIRITVSTPAPGSRSDRLEPRPPSGKRVWGYVLSAESIGLIATTLVMLRRPLKVPLRSGMLGIALLGLPLFMLGWSPHVALLAVCAFVARQVPRCSASAGT
jgi:hypothetical protein